MLEAFAVGAAEFGLIGSYRTELLLVMFDRILDHQNLDQIFAILTIDEHAAVLSRIGIFNTFNPYKIDGAYMVDLSFFEARKLAKLLIHMKINEVGAKWELEQYQFDMNYDTIPGWTLGKSWLATEDGLPSKGMLFVKFASSRGAWF